MTATRPAGIRHREAVAELKRSWRPPRFLLSTVRTPAACEALFTLPIGPALLGFRAGVAMERERGLIEPKRVAPRPAAGFTPDSRA